MSDFTELKNLEEIKEILPNKIERIQGINIEPLKVRIYGKTEKGFDFTFELTDRNPRPVQSGINITPF